MFQKQEDPSVPKSIWTLAFLVGLAMYAPMFCVPPMEHILRTELVLSNAQFGWLFSAPIIMMVAFALPGGLIADKIGIRRSAGIGILLISIGAILRSTTSSYSVLLLFTSIYGIGLGFTFPNLPKLVSIWARREESHIYTGIFTAGILTGHGLAMAITIPIIYEAVQSFQSVFLIWSIPVIVATVLWWLTFKEPSHNNTEKVSSKVNELRLRYILKNKRLWLLCTLFLLHNYFIYTWSGWTPVLLRSKGASADLAGIIASITVFVAIPAVLFLPRLAKKLKIRHWLLWIPGIVLGIVAWSATRVSMNESWFLMAVAGVANIVRFVSLLALSTEITAKERVGTAAGIVLSVGYTGAIIGPPISGYFLDLTNNLDLSFLSLIPMSIAATIIAFRLSNTRSELKGQ